MNTIDRYENLKIKYDALKREAAHYKKLFKKSNSELSREIAENVAMKLDLKNKNDFLVQRIKELNCLNEISRCDDDEDLNLDMFIIKVVSIIASAFRYPEYVSVEIKYKDRICQSENFVRTSLRLDQVLNSKNNIIGEISIFYNDGIAEIKTSPFLNEEKQILATIAYSLGQIIHRSETNEELQKAKEKAEESEEKYRSLSYNIPGMIYRADTDWLTQVITNLEKVCGYSIDEWNHQKMKWIDLIHPDDKQGIIEGGTKLAINPISIIQEYRIISKDGKIRWVSDHKTSVFKDDGSFKGVYGIVFEITERKQMEEELRLANENYKHIAQNIPEAILIIDRDSTPLYANKMASEVIGYSNSEILKLNFKDVLHPDDYDKAKLLLAARLAGHKLKQRYETKIKTKKGETKIVEGFGSNTKWMGEVVDLVVMNDITEKRRFESLLKIQDKIDYLSSIPEGLNVSLKKIFDSLFEFDWIDGGGIYLNFDEGLKLVFHRGVSESFVKKNQFTPLGSDHYRLVMRAKTQYFMFDSRQNYLLYLIEEGISSSLIIPLTHDNEVIGTLNLATRNHMELSENEKMIFESIATRISQTITLINIQEKLTSRNKELQKALKDKQEKQQFLIQKSKLASLGEMAAGVAHEINQPLGIIYLSLENILFKISEKKASQKYLDEKFSSIFNNIGKIKTIINHIRTFSHDQKSLIIERIDVNEVVRSACSLINEQYGYHNISLNNNLDEDIGYALGNNQKLEQVIFNLLSNAKFALEEKELLPMADSFDKEINIRTFSDSKKIYIELKDNGIGIEKENLPDIFNPFFTTKPEGVGTGLGLSIVYGIITDMKGAITINSDRNEYTLVKIELLRYKCMS